MTDTIQTLGSALGLGFLAGIRLYATVLGLGLAIRFGILHLSQSMSGLNVLAETPVLLIAGVGFLAEFFADKIPWLDSAWDGLHTFIRPVGAVFLGATALGHVDPVTQMAVGLLAGGVALTGHSAKAATRFTVNHSPEPFTNIGLSLLGDMAVPAGLWLTFEHPEIMLGAVIVFLIVFAAVAPRVLRFLRLEWLAVRSLFRKRTGLRWRTLPDNVSPNLMRVLSHVEPRVVHVPLKLATAVKAKRNWQPSVGVYCAAAKGVRGLRASSGYLCAGPDELAFVTRRFFRNRVHTIPVSEIREARLQPRTFVDQLEIEREDGRTEMFDVFKRGVGFPLPWRRRVVEPAP
jgi:hypothetical protein